MTGLIQTSAEATDFVTSDCFPGLIQSLNLSSLPDCRSTTSSWGRNFIFLILVCIILMTTNICVIYFYSNRNKLCPSSSRHISLLIWSRIYTVFALNREETVGVLVQFHIQVHRWCFVHKQPRVWELPGPDVSRWTRDQRHDREQHFCFLPGIYFCRSGGTVNFTLPFMTNVTISISTSQIFRSWVAIFQPRPPMASLFRSLYGMPGLAPRMDVLSWGRRDFQISFSNRDTSRNAWNRHWKFYGRYGDLFKQYDA